MLSNVSVSSCAYSDRSSLSLPRCEHSLYAFKKCKTPTNSIAAVLSAGVRSNHFYRHGECEYATFLPDKQRERLKYGSSLKSLPPQLRGLKRCILEILITCGGPMNVEELFQEIKRRRLHRFEGCKTPLSSLSAALNNGIRSKIFIRSGKRKFALHENVRNISLETSSTSSEEEISIAQSDVINHQQKEQHSQFLHHQQQNSQFLHHQNPPVLYANPYQMAQLMTPNALEYIRNFPAWPYYNHMLMVPR